MNLLSQAARSQPSKEKVNQLKRDVDGED